MDKPSNRPPEQFEEHWHEYKDAGWWILPALCVGAIVWIVIAWIIAIRYL